MGRKKRVTEPSSFESLRRKGSKLFRKGRYEAALKRYEEALKLVPEQDRTNKSLLHCKIAKCYMTRKHRKAYVIAVRHCNEARRVDPKNVTALLCRVRCYGTLNLMNAALRDVKQVLSNQPDNTFAQEILRELEIKQEERERMKMAEAAAEENTSKCPLFSNFFCSVS